MMPREMRDGRLVATEADDAPAGTAPDRDPEDIRLQGGPMYGKHLPTPGPVIRYTSREWRVGDNCTVREIQPGKFKLEVPYHLDYLTMGNLYIALGFVLTDLDAERSAN